MRARTVFLVGLVASAAAAGTLYRPLVVRTANDLATRVRSLSIRPSVAHASVPPRPAAVAAPPPPVAVTPPPAPAPTSDEPDPDDEPIAPAPAAGPELVATMKETWIYAAPSFKSKKLGYLRAGASMSRDEKPASRAGCEGGWYRVAPRGFVCAGASASLNLDHAVADLARRRPDRKAGLPYLYGMSKFPTPPFYLKLPSVDEQRSVEPDLAKHLAEKPKKAAAEPELDPVPGALVYGQIVPSLTPNHHGKGALYAGRAVPRSGFALVSAFEESGRRWGLTTDFAVVPLDRVRVLTPSAFHGVELGDGGLPAVFVRSKAARFYKRDAKTSAMSDDGAIGYREGVLLTGKRERLDRTTYLETRDGRFIVSSDQLVALDPPREWPSWANEGKRWIDVSILQQSLVAYEGKKPIYATLVSTGADGLGDPKDTHSTVRGAFLIHTKHVTVTMDSDEADDRFDLRDVPYVQYFHEGYALHAAYWHDDFGRPRSHGCINLHPTDAAWLFAWTTPDVPEAWHGAMSLKSGTTVYIHPLDAFRRGHALSLLLTGVRRARVAGHVQRVAIALVDVIVSALGGAVASLFLRLFGGRNARVDRDVGSVVVVGQVRARARVTRASDGTARFAARDDEREREDEPLHGNPSSLWVWTERRQRGFARQ